MGLLDSLYEPQTKYLIDVVLAIIGIVLSKFSDNLKGLLVYEEGLTKIA